MSLVDGNHFSGVIRESGEYRCVDHIDFTTYAYAVYCGEQHDPCAYCVDKAVSLWEQSRRLRYDADRAADQFADMIIKGKVEAKDVIDKGRFPAASVYAATYRRRKKIKKSRY